MNTYLRNKFLMDTSVPNISKLNISLERDKFLRDLLHHLSGTLQDVIGLEEASGFISIVGQQIGEEINNEYCSSLKVDSLDRKQVLEVLVDLKQRIHGNFSIVVEDENKVVLQTTSCPFGEQVKDRPSLCMMTSNVFGFIASENLGYAKVHLDETIATGSSGCRVVIYLTQTDETEGIEYYKG